MPCKNVPIIRRVKNHPTKKRHVQVQIISCFHHKFRRLNPVYIKHIFQTEHRLQSSIVEMFHDVYLNIQRFTLKRFKILISDMNSHNSRTKRHKNYKTIEFYKLIVLKRIFKFMLNMNIQIKLKSISHF